MTTLLDITKDALGGALKRSTKHAANTTMATPADKLDFKPADTSKSVREIAQHIIYANNLCLTTLGLEGDGDPTVIEPEDLVVQIEKGGSKLADYALQADESTLAKQVTFFGNDMETAKFLMIAEWHMSRHSGQIDYLQTTWGDMEDRFFG